MVSLCSVHQDASNDINVELEVTSWPRDLRSTIDVELVRSSYKYFDTEYTVI